MESSIGTLQYLYHEVGVDIVNLKNLHKHYRLCQMPLIECLK